MGKTDEALADVRRWLCDNLSEGDAGKVCGMLSVVSRRIAEIEEENAKLRELCRDMFTTISWCSLDCYPSDNKKREYADRMRGLGVEADDSV